MCMRVFVRVYVCACISLRICVYVTYDHVTKVVMVEMSDGGGDLFCEI